MSLTALPAWQALVDRRAALSDFRLTQAFGQDPRRADAYRVEAAGLTIDYSRQFLDEAALDGLLALAEASEFAAWRSRLFSGAIVNDSEGRAALHPALRGASGDATVRTQFAAEQARFLEFAEQLRSGRVTGSSGAAIDTVVCLGIGGSDLGPRLALDALRETTASSPVTLHLVANLDPLDLATALAHATPQRTLIVAISKSFGTLETLENLRAALDWLRSGGVADPSRHLAAVTARVDAARHAGVPAERIFPFDAAIGGRYSLWSACGLPIAVGAGRDKFEELLAGAAAMDAHFIQAPPRANAPLLLGLLSVWQTNFWGAASRAVFPYASRLRLLAAYLQQLEMESLGKSVDRTGMPLAYSTGNVVWGDVGSVAQHSVFQFLHQGTQAVPVEFIVDDSMRGGTRRERLLHANALAQAEALAFGDAALGGDSLEPHARVAGNRPSTIVHLPRVDAGSLGALLALYEHRVFVQSVLWHIDAFDQWGVELGKRLLARRIKEDHSFQESTT
jgi:glucose-6-phosphate isomerase